MHLALHSWRPNLSLQALLADSGAPPPAPEGRYLYADEQKRLVETLAVNYTAIVAMAIRGTSSKVIAAGFGVSREAIDRRLRPLGLKNPAGVRGRPPKSTQPATSQSTVSGSAPAYL